MDCQLKIYALHLLYIGENFRNMHVFIGECIFYLFYFSW